jgi:hypothetical protein
MRFPIAFESWYRVLSTALGLPPSSAYVEVGGEEVAVHMGWAFRSRFPKSAVRSAAVAEMRTISRGVHGFGGRWLVNGSGRNILSMELDPPQRGHVMGFPVRLRELLVSVEDAAAVTAALTGSGQR